MCYASKRLLALLCVVCLMLLGACQSAGRITEQNGVTVASDPEEAHIDEIARANQDTFSNVSAVNGTHLERELSGVDGKSLRLDAEVKIPDALLLDCQGLDTLATIYVNGEKAAYCDNMHRIWDIDIKAYVHEGENELRIVFSSPLKYMRAKNAECYVEGSCDCTEGFPHIRKAHCMMGWDWGPRLPDAGIWRCINLLAVDRARLISVRIHQEHKDGKVELSFYPDIKTYGGRCSCKEPDYGINVTVTAPNGTQFTSNGAPIVISNPELWWPNGYGAQPLYKVEAVLTGEGRDLDKWNARIGLRTMTMTRDKDEWGESFTLTVNGVKVFSMGADYIPEDNIFPRITPERTRRLLEDCKLANYNSIRVWGGGYYPDEWFYDACDELGLVVWQDFMFACSMYELSPEFEKSIRGEFVDNIIRLRHHASLGLWPKGFWAIKNGWVWIISHIFLPCQTSGTCCKTR